MSHSPAWKPLVAAAVKRIKRIHAESAEHKLERTAQVLEELAARREWFSFANFPLPAPGGSGSQRYVLHADPDQGFALYVNALHPGKTSVPHNHGTWAIIVGIEGEETNRVYRITADDGPAAVVVDREFKVEPGHPALYQPDDVHSIHVLNGQPALLFHLYGKALETLTDRVAFDLESGKRYPYNEKHFRPSVSTI